MCLGVGRKRRKVRREPNKKHAIDVGKGRMEGFIKGLV
jgi:hypothetical protein